MADPNPPTPKTTTKRKSPSPIDAKLVAQLEKDKEVINSIIDEINSDAGFATALATHFIDAANTIPATLVNIEALRDQADAASAVAADATSGTAEFHDVTDEEGGDMQTAITAIRGVQARAKEKYEETNPALLDAYYVGQPLSSRVQITQAATAAYTRLRTTDESGTPVIPQDTLPGYDQAKIDQLKADLGGYVSVQTKQSGAQEVATDKRGDFKTDSQQVSRRRRRLQLAIDAEYPHGPTNTARRRRLRLPTTKGMS